MSDKMVGQILNAANDTVFFFYIMRCLQIV